jgi:hypothetical protein
LTFEIHVQWNDFNAKLGGEGIGHVGCGIGDDGYVHDGLQG